MEKENKGGEGGGRENTARLSHHRHCKVSQYYETQLGAFFFFFSFFCELHSTRSSGRIAKSILIVSNSNFVLFCFYSYFCKKVVGAYCNTPVKWLHHI